jgi:hypothetical protein
MAPPACCGAGDHSGDLSLPQNISECLSCSFHHTEGRLCSKSTADHRISVVACLLELGLNDKDLEDAIMHTSSLMTHSSDRRLACV